MPIISRNEENMKLKLACCLIGICFLGCETKKVPVVGGREAPHAHQHASTLPEAITELSGYVETVGKAFTSNKPNDAHDALHDVGHVLESLTDLSKGLSDEKKAAVGKAAKELMECFGALDETMHGGPETPYTKVGDRITAAMASLKQASE
jgi:hypothetical protein